MPLLNQTSCRVAISFLPYKTPSLLKFLKEKRTSPLDLDLHFWTVFFRKYSLPWERIQKNTAWMEKASGIMCAYGDPSYPPLLMHISSAPTVLYGLGNLSIPLKTTLGMIGSRQASIRGKALAMCFAKTLAHANISVVSGLALGIDGAAHQGALSACSPLSTIAVLGSGFKYVYPKQHLPLAKAILQGKGALISEYPPDASPKPFYFPQRNRIIAGLGLGVLVIEARLKSGSLITAGYALDQDREVMAIPGHLTDPLHAGTNLLIQQGAHVILKPEDIFSVLNSK